MKGMSAGLKAPDWARLRERLATPQFTTGGLLVGLDFDGTLADIADRPNQAVLAADTRRLLSLLSRRRDVRLAILSGRGLQDVKQLVGLRGVYYAGNHGLEIHGPGLRWQHPEARVLSRSARTLLENDIQGFPGAFLEPKRLGWAIHYREMAPRLFRPLGALVRTRLLAFKEEFRLLHSKKTFDVRPNLRWNKGHALTMIRKGLPRSWGTMFVGDDHTDEEGFRTLGLRAITVRVGAFKGSSAQYVVPRRRLVNHLLEALVRRPPVL